MVRERERERRGISITAGLCLCWGVFFIFSYLWPMHIFWRLCCSECGLKLHIYDEDEAIYCFLVQGFFFGCAAFFSLWYGVYRYIHLSSAVGIVATKLNTCVPGILWDIKKRKEMELRPYNHVDITYMYLNMMVVFV